MIGVSLFTVDSFICDYFSWLLYCCPLNLQATYIILIVCTLMDSSLSIMLPQNCSLNMCIYIYVCIKIYCNIFHEWWGLIVNSYAAHKWSVAVLVVKLRLTAELKDLWARLQRESYLAFERIRSECSWCSQSQHQRRNIGLKQYSKWGGGKAEVKKQHSTTHICS